MKRQKVKKQKPNEQVQAPQNTAPNDPEKPFDFGGIPDRNLKKNLGCGWNQIMI